MQSGLGEPSREDDLPGAVCDALGKGRELKGKDCMSLIILSIVFGKTRAQKMFLPYPMLHLRCLCLVEQRRNPK